MAGNINTKTRKEFKPYKGKSSTILELASSLYGTCKTACAFTYVDIPAPLNPVAPESDANVTENIEIETSVSLPKPFDSVMKQGNITSLSDLPQHSTEQIAALEKATNDQHKCDMWSNHRVGRVTASKAHAIRTRMKTISKNPGSHHDLSATIRNVCTKGQPINTPDIKYGLQMEPEARKAFTKKLKADGHTNVQVKTCGLMLNNKYPCMAASPDGMITCDCCPTRVLEIKCPVRCIGKHPEEAPLEFWRRSNNTVALKLDHKFYDQVQVQMAIADVSCAEFVVYSRKGMTHHRILFNKVAFEILWRAIREFFEKYIIPHYAKYLDSGSELDVENVADEIGTVPTLGSAEVSMNELIYGDSMEVGGNETVETSLSTYEQITSNCSVQRSRKRQRKIKDVGPVYLCGVCSMECLSRENVMSYKDFSVQCEICQRWFHQICVSYKPADCWICYDCTAEAVHDLDE